MWKRTLMGNQPAYAICRIGIAMDRLAESNSPEEKISSQMGCYMVCCWWR